MCFLFFFVGRFDYYVDLFILVVLERVMILEEVVVVCGFLCLLLVVFEVVMSFDGVDRSDLVRCLYC